MPNHNPTLILGQSQSWLLAQGHDIPEHQLRDIEVRIYPQDGAGYYFVRGHAALKWYFKSDPNDNHFTACGTDDVDGAIKSNGRVQIVGYHGRSYGVWRTWAEFAEAVK